MTTEQFRTLLEQSGLSQAELARRLERSNKAVNDWNMGRVKPPGYVISWLEMRVGIRKVLDD